jgi:hypothetical protein
MNYFERMKASFDEELLKIAGELHGQTRIGRKPIGIERLLERETESEVTPSTIAPSGVKTSAAVPLLTPGRRAIGLMAAGAGAYHIGRKAEMDRRLGKQVRLQSRQ